MTPRNRAILEIATVCLLIATAIGHFLTGTHRRGWWFLTFLHLSLPVLFVLLQWSFRRDMRAHLAGTYVAAGTRLANEVTLAIATMFMWIAFATYAGLWGFPVAGLSEWPALGLFLVWLAWFVSAMRRARGYGFSFESRERLERT
jgi:hypothetical protein